MLTLLFPQVPDAYPCPCEEPGIRGLFLRAMLYHFLFFSDKTIADL
jgi:hypothetical protein